MRNLFKINKQKVIELFKFKKYPKKKMLLVMEPVELSRLSLFTA
jgi:hypothetical protein